MKLECIVGLVLMHTVTSEGFIDSPGTCMAECYLEHYVCWFESNINIIHQAPTHKTR